MTQCQRSPRVYRSPLLCRLCPRRAVTLVEVMLASFIMVLLSTVAYVSYGKLYQSSIVSVQAAKIQQLCVTARTWAIQNNASYAANLDLDNPAFWLSDDGVTTRTKLTVSESVDALAQLQYVVKDGPTTITAGQAIISFRPDGSCENAFIGVRHKEFTSNPRSAIVEIYGSTGAVRVVEKN